MADPLGVALASVWTPTVFLDPSSQEPVYLQIAHALMHEIHRGRLKPGDGLPGYRTLAAQLGVNRNTVMAAFRELQVEGWVTSLPGEGSLVALHPPNRLPGEDAPPVALGFDLGGGARPEADAARTLTNAVHAPAAAVTNASNALASAPAKLEGALSGGGGLGLLGGTGLLERAAQGVSQEFGALRQAGALLLTPTGGIRALTSAAGLLSPAATTAGNALAPLGNAIEAAYLTFEASVQYALELFQYAVQFVPYASVLASQITIFYNLIEPIVQATLFNVIDIIDQTVTISQGLTNFWTATTAAVNQFIRAEFSQFLPPLPPLPPLPHFP